MMLRRLFVTPFLVLACIAVPMNAAVPATDADVERGFTSTVQPFLNSYCVTCHSGDKAAAQLDLRKYTSPDGVVADYIRWNRVMARLTAKEMPPKNMKQPSDAERQQVIDWIQGAWGNEARKHDGDPGVVLARRLSNAEYDYTIRDLTGVDIQPAKEFPVDPANQAGFDNSGESLAMSTALLNKYLLAARDVADHMYLNASGFAFAPHPMLVETDRDQYCIQQIIEFYDRQDTDYADYFRAAWMYKNRGVLGRPKATLADIAAQTKVSAKYLATIWQALEPAKDDIGPLAKLQTMWRALPVPKANQPDLGRAGAEQMRDFVARMRSDTSLKFASPAVIGLSATSQPLMNWKNVQYAAHRRDFDRAALRVEGEPPPPAPVLPAGRGSIAQGNQGVAAGRGRGAGPGATNADPQAAAATAANPAAPARGRGRGANLDPAAAAAAAEAAAADMTKLKADVAAYTSRMANTDLEVPTGQRPRYEAAFAKFASVFPDTFYVRERGRSYPDDSEDKGRLLSAGFHNVMGYTRDDTPLRELILDDKGQKELDALWDQFEFVADYTARTYVQFFFNQSGEVQGHGRETGTLRPAGEELTADAVIMDFKKAYLAKAAANTKNNPVAFEAIAAHFDRVNAVLRGIEKERVDAEPRQLDTLMKFAARAYRRPLSAAEQADLLGFYHSLREKSGLTHEEAMRDSIVSVLMSPYFCYRLDLTDVVRLTAPSGRAAATAAAGTVAGAAPGAVSLSDYALASRLSYFLWSTMPDAELLSRAAAGDLRKDTVLKAQIHRMMKDDRALALATEFGGNWLDFRRFEQLNTVDRERFPAFTNDLREAMFQEPIRFISDVMRNDRSVLDMLYGTYTFVNPALAAHYGMPPVAGGPDAWVRIDNAQDYQRGGLLPMAVFLTQNAPGLRTSPVKRGYWVARRVLGEIIPPPPPVVPELPKDEAKLDAPLRQVLEQHRRNPACASCHERFDTFGLTLENYGPVGEARTKDLAGHSVDTRATFPGGTEGAGLTGLQTYIHANREKDFVDNLSRKMLVYALGRSLLISDEPLIQRMNTRLAASGYKFSTLIETVITSPQFMSKRTSDSLNSTVPRKVAN